MPNLANQKDLITTLFTVFAGFSAFGAAIVAFLAQGGGLQASADWWRQHGLTEAQTIETPSRRRREEKKAGRRSTWAVVVAAAFIAVLVVLPSGLGLLSSFAWLRASADGSTRGWSWAYTSSVGLFWWEAAAITLVTIAAVMVAAASTALPNSNRPVEPAIPQQAAGAPIKPDGGEASAGSTPPDST
jgi:hypothetical protein